MATALLWSIISELGATLSMAQSHYVSGLREQSDEEMTGSDGISWPSLVGVWSQDKGINELAAFAANFDVPELLGGDSYQLNSVPMPWARLLLFESALFNSAHPAHQDVESQWRGLLGVIALAVPLGLNISLRNIKLSEFAQSEIAKTFLDLRPQYVADGRDQETGKWDNFQMLEVDGVVIGATSPRTLVFTGTSQRCPSSIPFLSAHGSLIDPALYYRQYGDSQALGLLAYWLDGFIRTLESNNDIRVYLGNLPRPRGGMQISRLNKMLEYVKAWQKSFQGVTRIQVPGAGVPVFTLYPFSMLTGLSGSVVADSPQSDLFLSGRDDVLVCYRVNSQKGASAICDQNGNRLVGTPLRVYGFRWVKANEPLPQPINFVPNRIRVIEDPAVLFEDHLIQVNLPEKPLAVHYLEISEQGGMLKRFLYPFKSELLQYLSSDEIAHNTKIEKTNGNSIRVTLKFPLASNRAVIVSHEYPENTAVLTAHEGEANALVVWPDFTHENWHRYFYFKQRVEMSSQVDFEPLDPIVPRTQGINSWYVSEVPLRAFVGKIDSKQGLLLIRDRRISGAAHNYWKVGVDFGSTHTRIFSLQVDSTNSYNPLPGAKIEPVRFQSRAQLLTYGEKLNFKEYFFTLSGGDYEKTELEHEELKTLLMLPEKNAANSNDWLPREGYVYFEDDVRTGDYTSNSLRQNLKWNSNRNDYDLRAYLRCLLVMAQAEAISRGAQIVWISHTYPSVFTKGLVDKHNNEWQGLALFLNRGITGEEVAITIPETKDISGRGVSETVAVCRHLMFEQNAAPTANTISLDVGGSTTDIAVWSNAELKLQESVKMAAGIVGHYLQSKDAADFLEWFEKAIHGSPFNMTDVLLATFSGRPSGYSLMFNAVLSKAAGKNLLNRLINSIQTAKESRKLLSQIIFLFSGLVYYTGLLARKAGLADTQSTFYIYFCGRGGTLVTWITGYEKLVGEMFLAGLYGPAGKKTGSQPAPDVKVMVSAKPKEEVGRGLLAESALQGKADKDNVGLLDLNPPSVTVGDTGYGTLAWDDELNREALLSLSQNTVPAIHQLQELNTFLEAFKQKKATQAAAQELRLDQVGPNQLKDSLGGRLFGPMKGGVIYDLNNYADDALLEPLFITEIKVLLETATGNSDLFS